MEKLEFWIWRERDGFILSDGELRLPFTAEADAIDAAVRIAQQVGALYSIAYARHVPA